MAEEEKKVYFKLFEGSQAKSYFLNDSAIKRGGGLDIKKKKKNTGTKKITFFVTSLNNAVYFLCFIFLHVCPRYLIFSSGMFNKFK